MTIKTLHEKVFLLLEAHRNDHPDFKNWFTASGSKSKLKDGYWFQGMADKKEVYVGLYKHYCDYHKTRSVNLYFKLENGTIQFGIVIVFDTSTDEKNKSLFNTIMNELELDFTLKSNSSNYQKHVSNLIPDNDLKRAKEFLIDELPKINQIIKTEGQSDFFITKDEFLNLYSNINQYRSMLETDPIKKMIDKYKARIRRTRLKEELFKWQRAKQYQGGPDINAEDFYQVIYKMDFSQLVYHNGTAVLRHIAKDNPEGLKEAFRELYNQDIVLEERLKMFDKTTLEIYRTIDPGKQLSHHQDERSMSTYLAYYDANQYPFYKASFYKKYCNLLGVKSAKSGQRYMHYISLLNDLIANYIESDAELLQLKDELLDETCHEDANHLILAQDILYQVLDSSTTNKTTKEKASPNKYWLFAPGENADHWEEFYQQGIMALGWDELGDLSEYASKKEIVKKLQELQQTTSSKKNDATANDEFCNKMSIGDMVIVKTGKLGLLGYGTVASDYYFDEERSHYKSCRKVNWIKKGNWTADHDLVLKTLTDITKYPTQHPNYEKYTELLLAIIDGQFNTSNMTHPLNTLFYGPPGTGKTYTTILRAAQIILGDETMNDYKKAQAIFNDNLGDQIEFITFHQNYSYEDFIQGLRPDVDNGNELAFERKDGVFKRIADRALQNIKASERPEKAKANFEKIFNEFIAPLTEGEVEEIEIKMKRLSFYIIDVNNKSISFRKPSGGTGHTLSISTLKRMYEVESTGDIQGLSSYYTPLLNELLSKGKAVGVSSKVEKQNYVLIIDEINRANISRVFGELITLIEPDKRSHGAIPLKCTLPSGEEFVVPSNLYLIGTMNTADKSIALLDIALRRRFVFEAMYPVYAIENQTIHYADLLEKINKEIIKRKGYDFQIGHSYFMGENFDLIQCMNRKVIPLLLEYFMNDEKEVRGILKEAGLEVDQEAWPLKINENGQAN